MIDGAGYDDLPGDEIPYGFPITGEEAEVFDGSSILAKASDDCWHYLIVTAAGLEIQCRNVESRGLFVKCDQVLSIKYRNGDVPGDGDLYFGRGVEVRLSEIVLLVDQDS